MNIWLHNILCNLFIHLKPRFDSFWGVLSCCLTPSILYFLFWNDVSLVPVRVLHKDEKILGRKHIYLPHAQTAIYDSKVKLFLKQGISFKTQVRFILGRTVLLLNSIHIVNFRYKKIKTYMANLFAYFDGALPRLFTEMKVCWKAFLKGGILILLKITLVCDWT
jgi:hypothetical protein